MRASAIDTSPEEQSYRILMLEDNEGDAILVEDYLLEYIPKCQVSLAKKFKDAALLLAQENAPFDAILLDLNLPDKSGTELIQAVTELTYSTPIIVLTGMADHSFSMRSLEMGVSDYLLKGEFNAFALYKSVVYSIEKNKMQRTVAQHNHRLKSVLEIARVGYWTFDNERKVFHCSDEMCEILGLPDDCEQLSLQQYRDLVHPDDRSYFDAHFNIFNNGQEVEELEHRISTENGELIHVYQRAEIIRDSQNNVQWVDGIVQDITSRKDQEELQMLLESVITNAKDAVMITEARRIDEPGPSILYVNEAFTALTGYRADEVIGQSPRILQGPKTERSELDKLRKHMEIYEPCQIEVINYHKNGGQYWVEMSIVPVKDNLGRCTHFISIERDVTERKLQEYLLKDFTRSLEKQVKERTADLQRAHALLEHHFNQMRDSIVYAERIQRAVLPTEKQLLKIFKRSFVLFEPRDLVSGDFLWCHQVNEDVKIIAVIDCVGHGVPGAMLSMIGYQLLNQSVKSLDEPDPAAMLAYLHRELLHILRYQKAEYRHYDGMDASVCVVDESKNTIDFCGAGQKLYFASADEVIPHKGSKFTIGAAKQSQVHKSLRTIKIPYKSGDMFFMSSDGFADQFGGPKNKKLMGKRFRELLGSVLHLPPSRQREKLMQQFIKWRKHEEQTDDVLLVGVRL